MVKTICAGCGREIWRYPCQIKRTNESYCSRACHMAKLNADLNPYRMADEVRAALSLSKRGTGERKTYERSKGRHVHRQVAEQILGRKLRPGEIVHHINGDKRDNRPENLMIFENQAEHARWHAQHREEVRSNEVHSA